MRGLFTWERHEQVKQRRRTRQKEEKGIETDENDNRWMKIHPPQHSPMSDTKLHIFFKHSSLSRKQQSSIKKRTSNSSLSTKERKFVK